MLGRMALLAATNTETALWTPANITTALWLDSSDAATITASGGLVSQWADKSGNLRHATQATAGIQPATGNGIQFTSDRLNLPAAAWPTDAHSLIAVMQSSTTGAAGCGLININTNPVDDPELRIGVSDGVVDYINGGYVFQYNAGLTISKTIVCVEHVPGVTSTVYVNGATGATATRAGAPSPTSLFQLGYYQTVNGYRNGTLWDLIVFPSSLDSREKAEGFLAHKHSMAGGLPAGHPYKSTPPTA